MVLASRAHASYRQHRRPPARGGGGRDRGSGAAVSLLPDGPERGQPPAGRGQPEEDRQRDGRRRRRGGPDPGRLHLPRPVHRPRPDLRQDRRHARRERLAGAAPPGALAEPRSRLAVRRRAAGSRVGQVLRGRWHPPQDREDGGGRRHPREERLRPAARRRQHGGQEAQGGHPGPAQRREPGGCPDAPRHDPLSQPRRRQAARLGPAVAALRAGPGASSPSTTSG